MGGGNPPVPWGGVPQFTPTRNFLVCRRCGCYQVTRPVTEGPSLWPQHAGGVNGKGEEGGVVNTTNRRRAEDSAWPPPARPMVHSLPCRREPHGRARGVGGSVGMPLRGIGMRGGVGAGGVPQPGSGLDPTFITWTDGSSDRGGSSRGACPGSGLWAYQPKFTQSNCILSLFFPI